MGRGRLTLPESSETRKLFPLYDGCFKYFPAALAGVALHSKKGNTKHNPGEPLHHARGKSQDHDNCILRHTMDLADMLAMVERGEATGALIEEILEEADARCWRALAASQELYETFREVPMAPGAKDEG